MVFRELHQQAGNAAHRRGAAVDGRRLGQEGAQVGVRVRGLDVGDSVESGIVKRQVLGVADRYGSLEKGKVANVVVWSKDPLELDAAPEHVFIRGREVERTSRQTALFERYRKR